MLLSERPPDQGGSRRVQPHYAGSAPSAVDIIFDVIWSVEVEREVEQWIDDLPAVDFAAVLVHIERLGVQGSLLRMPASRSLGDGAFELRFNLRRMAWRITYYFAADHRIVLLTVFRKQRQNERHEVQRARRAITKCIAEDHTAEDEESQ